MSEIFPSRIREAGVAIGTSTQWLFNFVFSQATPHAVENLGWRTFLMFAIFNFALVVFVWFFIKETKGRSLEEMEERKSHINSPFPPSPTPRLSFTLSYCLNPPNPDIAWLGLA